MSDPPDHNLPCNLQFTEKITKIGLRSACGFEKLNDLRIVSSVEGEPSLVSGVPSVMNLFFRCQSAIIAANVGLKDSLDHIKSE